MKKCTTCKQDKEDDQFWKGMLACNSCMLLRMERKQVQRDSISPEGKQRRILQYLLRVARRRAKEKGLECTIRTQDIPFTNTCPILGVPLKENTGKLYRDAYTLDRKDSTLGYVPGNVFILSWRANNIKSDLTFEQIEKLYLYMKGTI